MDDPLEPLRGRAGDALGGGVGGAELGVLGLEGLQLHCTGAPDEDVYGVLVAGVKDSLPPFGYVDEKTRAIVGYDIDFVNAIAKKLGVKVELKPVTSATRPSRAPSIPSTATSMRLPTRTLDRSDSGTLSSRR